MHVAAEVVLVGRFFLFSSGRSSHNAGACGALVDACMHALPCGTCGMHMYNTMIAHAAAHGIIMPDTFLRVCVWKGGGSLAMLLLVCWTRGWRDTSVIPDWVMHPIRAALLCNII